MPTYRGRVSSFDIRHSLDIDRWWGIGHFRPAEAAERAARSEADIRSPGNGVSGIGVAGVSGPSKSMARLRPPAFAWYRPWSAEARRDSGPVSPPGSADAPPRLIVTRP